MGSAREYLQLFLQLDVFGLALSYEPSGKLVHPYKTRMRQRPRPRQQSHNMRHLQSSCTK